MPVGCASSITKKRKDKNKEAGAHRNFKEALLLFPWLQIYLNRSILFCSDYTVLDNLHLNPNHTWQITSSVTLNTVDILIWIFFPTLSIQLICLPTRQFLQISLCLCVHIFMFLQGELLQWGSDTKFESRHLPT